MRVRFLLRICFFSFTEIIKRDVSTAESAVYIAFFMIFQYREDSAFLLEIVTACGRTQTIENAEGWHAAGASKGVNTPPFPRR